MANTPVTIESAVATVGYLVTPPFTTTDSYTFSFPYLNQTDFEIEVRDTILETTDFEFTSDYLINLTAVGVSKLNGLFGDLTSVPVIIRRRTESSTRLVDFINNSTLTDVELDLQSDQLFYLIQEVYDNANLGGVNFNPVSNDIDMEGSELLNVGYPLSEASAANLASILDNVVIPDYAEGDTYRSGRFVMYGDDLYRANKDVDDAPAVFEVLDFDLIMDASELAKISGMESDIITNTTDITTNANNISTNAVDIATNTADIATNVSNISTNASNIATNVSNISTNATDISTNVSNISTNTGSISGNTTDITNNYNAITALDVRVTTNEGDIGANSTDISNNTANISTNALSISNHIAEDVTAHTQVGTYSEIGVWANTATDGAQAYATDVEKYYFVVSGGLVEMGAGTASGGGVASLDTIYSQSFEDSLVSDFGTSTATGTFEGTLSLEGADPLNGSISLKYTQASGSGSDYFYMGSSVLSGIDIPLKAQNDRILLKFPSSYSGDSGDIRVKLIDTTTLTEITDAVLDIESGPDMNRLYVELSNVSRVTVRFEVVTENIGAELLIDDLEIIANPGRASAIINTDSATLVQAKYYITPSTANLSFTNGSYVVVDFNEKEWDTHNAVTTGTSWKFTAPKKGRYEINYDVLMNGATTTATRVVGRIYINNNEFQLADIAASNGTSGYNLYALDGYKVIELEEGDELDLRLEQSSGSTQSIVTATANRHSISICEVPNYEDVVLTYLEESQVATSGVERRLGKSIDGKPIYETYIKVTSDITTTGTVTSIAVGLDLIDKLNYTSTFWQIVDMRNTDGSNRAFLYYDSSDGGVKSIITGSNIIKAGTTFRLEYTK